MSSNPEDMDNDLQEESDEDTAMDINQEIQVEFEGFQMSDNDFHGISRLLRQLFPKENFNLSAITDLMIGQSHIGTVLKQAEIPEDSSDDSDDSEEVFGVTTCLPMTKGKDNDTAINNMIQQIIKHCKTHSVKNKTKALQLLDAIATDPSKRVGWIINERFINIPPKISLPMFEKLTNELSVACKKNHKVRYDFTHYLVICKTCVPINGNLQTPTHFLNAEEELFSDAAEISFTYPLPEADTVLAGNWEDEKEMKPCRTVLIMSQQEFQHAYDNLKIHLY